MAWYRTYLRTDRERDSKTANDYYCFFRNLYQSEGALATRCGSLKTFSITQGTLGNRKGRMAVA